MKYSQFTSYSPPHTKRLLGNLEITNGSFVWFNNKEYVNITCNFYRDRDITLGSLHYMPDVPTFIVPDGYGLCDGVTRYERKYHQRYFDIFGRERAGGQVVRHMFPKMTSNVNEEHGITITASTMLGDPYEP